MITITYKTTHMTRSDIIRSMDTTLTADEGKYVGEWDADHTTFTATTFTYWDESPVPF